MTRPPRLRWVWGFVALVAGCGSGNTPSPAVSSSSSALASTALASVAPTSTDADADLGATAVGVVGDPNAKVVLDLFEDFLCPACAGFERAYGAQLAEAAAQGRLAVRHHMLNFLDRNSASGDYSSRAAGAAKCVDLLAAGAYQQFHSRLFATGVQPKEAAKSDLSNEQLAKLAADVGASAAADCVRSGAQVPAAKALADRSLEQLSSLVQGRVFTPAAFAEGKRLDTTDKQWLAKLLVS